MNRLLSDARGRHDGARGIIVACGPSLRRVNPLDLLPRHTFAGRSPEDVVPIIVITMNDAPVWLTREHPMFPRIDYHVVLNPTWYELLPATLAALYHEGKLVGLRRTGTPLPFANYWLPSKRQGVNVETDVMRGVYPGNATLVSLQWGAFLGLSPMYVLGLDLKFEDGIEHGSDPNRASVLRNLMRQRQQFRGQRKVFEQRGVHVFNCNEDSACTEFRHAPLRDAFA